MNKGGGAGQMEHIKNSLDGYCCCIRCMKAVPGRQTFTNQPRKVLHPTDLSRDSNMCLYLAQTALLFQLFSYTILKAYPTTSAVTPVTHLQPASQRICPKSQQCLWKYSLQGVRQEGRGKVLRDPGSGQACTCKELHPRSSSCLRCNYHLEWLPWPNTCTDVVTQPIRVLFSGTVHLSSHAESCVRAFTLELSFTGRNEKQHT